MKFNDWIHSILFRFTLVKRNHLHRQRRASEYISIHIGRTPDKYENFIFSGPFPIFCLVR